MSEHPLPDSALPALRHPPSLLLVDDEKAFADALAFRLETRGAPCLVAYSGAMAMELLGRQEIELVLLDLNMPGQHGLDVLLSIKKQRKDVEVILLTGEADLSTASCGMRRGASDYLLKPVDMEALLAAIGKGRKRATEHREQLRALEAGKLMALGSLAAGVGHEINNPLQIMLQRAEFLQELVAEAQADTPDFDEIAKTAAILENQARRIAGITSQLLELAHKSRTGEAETNLRGLLQTVFARMEERAKALGVTLQLAVEDGLPVLPCSSAELEPVFVHLGRNALDAVEALQMRLVDAGQATDSTHHTLGIRVYAKGDSVTVEVRDSGEGIAPEHAPHVFEPFFSTRPVGKGVGMGLTVCHSLMTSLRGSIRFIPLTPSGTLFMVTIPVTGK